MITGGILSILNNGSLIATPYNLSRTSKYYVFVQKRNKQIGITVNTSGVKPATPAHTYTMTDTTALSTSLIVYLGCQGYGDYGGQCWFDDLDISLF